MDQKTLFKYTYTAVKELDRPRIGWTCGGILKVKLLNVPNEIKPRR